MLLFFLVTLTIWRAAILLTEEDGPYSVFNKIRSATTKLKFVNFDCFNCTSLQLSLPLAFIFSQDLYVLIYWFALAGGALLIQTIYERLQ